MPSAAGLTRRVELDIQPDIQAACNAGLMSRVVVNLLQNAYKYGGEQVRRSCSCTAAPLAWRARPEKEAYFP